MWPRGQGNSHLDDIKHLDAANNSGTEPVVNKP